MLFCTAPNRAYVKKYKWYCLGICVFLYSSEPTLQFAHSSHQFWYMQYLYNSEPHSFLIGQQRELWYMCVAQLQTLKRSTPVKATVLVYAYLHSSEPISMWWIRKILFWYMRAVQLWTPFIWCFCRERSFGICVFAQLRTGSAIFKCPLVFWYMHVVQLQTRWTKQMNIVCVFVYVFLHSSEPSQADC